MIEKKFLIIDGNYFAHRVIGQLNSKDAKNNLETEREINEFKQSLHLSLYNLCGSFNNERHNLINHVIFVSDAGSWRKKITPHIPYYFADKTDIPFEYKGQRKEKKEESSINYDNFYQLYSDFVDQIKTDNKVIVIKHNLLEGDDLIALISNKLAGTNQFGIVFATDGDLDQVVRNNVCLFRNIRSKSAPNGEFVITNELYRMVYEQSAMDKLLGNSIENSYFKTLFGISIGFDSFTKRTINEGISMATPYKTALVKSLAGDKKDNIFSTISWLSSTGTRRYSVTEKIIEKALAKHGYALLESTCKAILTSKEQLYQLILSVIEVTKQDIQPDIVLNHFKHNLKLNLLSRKMIPEDLLNYFDDIWPYIQERMNNENIDVEQLSKPMVQYKNMGKNIMEESIPEEI